MANYFKGIFNQLFFSNHALCLLFHIAQQMAATPQGWYFSPKGN